MNPEPFPKTDMTKSDLPRRLSYNEMAEELLARFPGVDRAELCKEMIGTWFFEMRFGNKREERNACEMLNAIQAMAEEQIKKDKR